MDRPRTWICPALSILTEIVDKRVNNKSSADDTDRAAQMDETIVHVEFGHTSTIRFNVSQIADVSDSVLWNSFYFPWFLTIISCTFCSFRPAKINSQKIFVKKRKNCHRGSTMSLVEGVVVNTVRGAAIGSIAKLMDMHTYREKNSKRFAWNFCVKNCK